MTRDNKVQLGVRVPADVRTAARNDAARKAMSLNAYVEHLIVQAHGNQPILAPLAGQITVDDILNGQDELQPPPDGIDSYPPGEDTMVAHGQEIRAEAVARAQTEVAALRPFARNCRNGTLHWKHGPGNPCKYCEGEV